MTGVNLIKIDLSMYRGSISVNWFESLCYICYYIATHQYIVIKMDETNNLRKQMYTVIDIHD